MANPGSKERLAAIAGRSWGRVTWVQILELDVPRSTLSKWLRQGYLHRRLPRVYAVGHAARSVESDLAEALLYAGPGAMLSHATAAWWLGLLDSKPRVIHVSTPRQCRSRRGIRVHGRRTTARDWHKGFPTTTIPQTLIDVSADQPLRTLRLALARADYAGTLDVAAVEAAMGSGRRGAAKLRRALAAHQPSLARTKSRVERLFFELCEAAGFPLPEVNERIAGWEVDALWRDKRIAVELDGYGNHHTPAQLKRDRRKELALRAVGYTTARYSEEQLTDHVADVVADVRRLRS